MKLRGIHIILIVILVVSILLITSSDSVVPYSKDTLFSNMYRYEGMAMPDMPSTPPPPPITPGSDGMFGSMGNPMQEKKEPKMVEGFALQPAPFNDNAILDRYGNTPSGPQCFGQSGGYSNSLGPLCFSQEDVRLLSTRGGNISGSDSTIGN
jgi:hypothetical protein